MKRPVRLTLVAGAAALILVPASLSACSVGQPAATNAPPSSPGRALGSAGSSGVVTPSGGGTSTVPSLSATPPSRLAVTTHWEATHTAGWVDASTVGAGKLWIGYALAGGRTPQMHGEVVGYDLTTGRPEVTMQVGAFPQAIAATSEGVWVANEVGDLTQPGSPYLDTVQQFTTMGTLVATTRVPYPAAITAAGTNAWVYYQPQGESGQAHVRLITPTHGNTLPAETDTPIPGVGAAGQIGFASLLVHCAGKLYAASNDASITHVILTEITSQATTLATEASASTKPSLGCTPAGSPVMMLPGKHLAVVTKATDYRPAPVNSTDFFAYGAVGGPHLWIADDVPSTHTLTISTVNDRGTTTSKPLTSTEPGNPLLAADSSGLWEIQPSQSASNDTTIRVEHLTTTN